jgi:hypothetical protein
MEGEEHSEGYPIDFISEMRPKKGLPIGVTIVTDIG